MTMIENDHDLETFMAIAQEQAIADAKLMPTTPEIRQRAQALVEFARDRLAAKQREERAKRPSNVVPGGIRDAIRAMSPAQVFAQLTELCGAHPELHFAHRDFSHLSEEDLRSALEDAESLIERGV